MTIHANQPAVESSSSQVQPHQQVVAEPNTQIEQNRLSSEELPPIASEEKVRTQENSVPHLEQRSELNVPSQEVHQNVASEQIIQSAVAQQNAVLEQTVQNQDFQQNAVAEEVVQIQNVESDMAFASGQDLIYSNEMTTSEVVVETSVENSSTDVLEMAAMSAIQSEVQPNVEEQITTQQSSYSPEPMQLSQAQSQPNATGNYQYSVTDTKEELKKPNYTYKSLIIMALQSAPEFKMSLNEIYNYISRTFPYYGKMPDWQKKKWENSIRHNLSLQTHSGQANNSNFSCFLFVKKTN